MTMNNNIDISDRNYSRTRTAYYVVAEAVTKDGQVVPARIEYDPVVAGANPHYWTLANNNNVLGHEFKFVHDARIQAKYAAGRSGMYNFEKIVAGSERIVEVTITNTQSVELVNITPM